MSSESRNEILETLLATRYAMVNCSESEKDAHARRFHEMVDLVLEKHPEVNRYDLLEAIRDKFIEYSRNRRGYEKPRSSMPRR